MPGTVLRLSHELSHLFFIQVILLIPFYQKEKKKSMLASFSNFAEVT